ncbi:class I SAM-dependent methyltransferase [Eubacteriales bacterium OttesenSCG-928-A19]|nr:class I SAM-dependent methyltransferase [Eubacteriales bacterium OttesenSCG-928-A19]
MNDAQYKALSIREFDAAAEKFDDNDPSIYNLCHRDYPDIVAELTKQPFDSVLDAGCGTGAILAMLKKEHPDKQYTGIDLSPGMIEVASRKALPGVTFLQGDCENLPFDPDSFDAVLCSQSFHHYPHPESFFASVYRVLRPGGRLILRDMTARSAARWFFNHIEIPLINLLLKKGDVRVYGKDDIEAFCRGAGLAMVSYERRKGFRMHCVCRK